LRPGGRVGFVDEDDRAHDHDDVDEPHVATRTLADGRTFEIVKIFWRPADLRERLPDWELDVRRVGDTYLFGVGTPKG
jgi:hypothetical protein